MTKGGKATAKSCATKAARTTFDIHVLPVD